MRNNRKVFWGVLLIALAVFIILDQLGIINIVVGTMHLLIGVMVMVVLIESLNKMSFPGIFLSLAVLWILFDEYITDYDISEFLVLIIAVLFTIGFSLLFPNAGRNKFVKVFGSWSDNKGNWEDYADVDKEGKYQQVKNEEKDGCVYCSNRMGASAKYINCPNLKYADISNSFGELQVYFDNAVIDETEATIKVDNSFGELRLYIPSEWVVVNNINAFAASVNERKARNNIAGEKRVIITGSVSFGEIEINYV